MKLIYYKSTADQIYMLVQIEDCYLWKPIVSHQQGTIVKLTYQYV